MMETIARFLKPLIPAPLRRTLRQIQQRTRAKASRPCPPPMKRADGHLEAVQRARQRIRANTAVKASAMKPIHRFFNSLGVRTQVLPAPWWSQLLSSGSAAASSTLAEFADCTKNLDPQILETREWLELYALLLRIGLYHPAYFVRDFARMRALSVDATSCTPQERRLCLAAALELQDFDRAEDICLMLEQDGDIDQTQLVAVARFLITAYGDVDGLDGLLLLEEDRQYRDYLVGRSVALVGPATTASRDAGEIDSLDRVVRLNYGESGRGCDSQHRGQRCDVTYFNHEFARRLFASGKEIPEEVAWVVFKGAKWKTEYAAAFEEIHSSPRGLDVSPHRALFSGDFNMVPNAVLDLLRFNPKSLKVFHADLMLTVDRFDGYHWWKDASLERRPAEHILLIENYLRSLVFHDPVPQYVLLSNLWKAGRIIGDGRFTEVMALGCEEYMRQMQAVYGEPYNAYLWRNNGASQ